jgi:choline dehydrogenase-like flavoprotein
MVCDGAAVPANPGVNPSLTITAMAEHAMAQVPAKEVSQVDGFATRSRPEAAAPLNRSGLRPSLKVERPGGRSAR